MKKLSTHGEPEHFFRVPNNHPLDTDAHLCALRRALAMIIMLRGGFDDDVDRFNDEIMTYYCWAIEGLISQAIMMVEADIGHGGDAPPLTARESGER